MQLRAPLHPKWMISMALFLLTRRHHYPLRRSPLAQPFVLMLLGVVEVLQWKAAHLMHLLLGTTDCGKPWVAAVVVRVAGVVHSTSPFCLRIGLSCPLFALTFLYASCLLWRVPAAAVGVAEAAGRSHPPRCSASLLQRWVSAPFTALRFASCCRCLLRVQRGGGQQRFSYPTLCHFSVPNPVAAQHGGPFAGRGHCSSSKICCCL